MNRIVGALVGVFACATSAYAQSDIAIPHGYRQWELVSVATVGGNQDDLRAKLGNPVAIKAFRAGTVPFPDGTIIARLAWKRVQSEQNNTAFRAAGKAKGAPDDAIAKLLAESFVAGEPTNVQFMVKDSKKYATTGGWGFAEFTDGKPSDATALKPCFGCHTPAKDHDFVFTHYAP
jgi:hypothetical protein